MFDVCYRVYVPMDSEWIRTGMIHGSEFRAYSGARLDGNIDSRFLTNLFLLASGELREEFIFSSLQTPLALAIFVLVCGATLIPAGRFSFSFHTWL
ncbi:hypothetical protein L208DRAFT_1408708 [Tricholoma matsutake]|nr:hypothetical protein L208DRAFT_1408708 [Tricholoma matsutake 945]